MGAERRAEAPVAAPIAVRTIGRAARRALSGNATGRTIAVFRRSFYAETPQGLACFGASSLGAGPLNALGELADGFDGSTAGLEVGAPVRIEDKVVEIGSRLRFTLERAADWRPDRGPWRPDLLGRGLARLRELALTRTPTEGLAPVVFRGVGPRPMVAGAAAFRGWLDAALAIGLADPPFEVEGLIGLGPGLTPAGDDYLGGALVALRAFGRADAADRLGAWTLAKAKARTTTISLAHLAAAAAGEGAEALHLTLAALAAGRTEALAAGLDRIDSIGHSSGWDGLAGVVAACTAIAEAARG